MRTIATSVALSVIATLVVSSWSAPAEARRAGKIYILRKRPPARFKRRGGLRRFLRKYRTSHIWPNKKNKKEWRFEYMAFFKRPVRDRQIKIRFYDITAGRKFVAADSIFTSSMGQRAFASDMVLEKGRFKRNRRYIMYLLNRRNVVLAKTRFTLRGRGPRYSGRVTFTDKEAR